MENGEIWSLIARYAAKSISPGDQDRLLLWADSNPENRRILDEVTRVWGITGKKLTLPEPDTQKEWGALMERIKAEEESPVRKIYRIPYVVRAAATLIIVMVVAMYAMLHETENAVTAKYSRKLSAFATTDSVKWFYLPDGSAVWLNAHTTLQFDSSFTQRKTWLEGEAYFEVVSRNNAPFVVEAGDIRVTVRGTSFNVKSQHNGNTEVVVVTGRVEFAASDSTVQKKFLLGVEDKGTYVAKDQLLSVLRNDDPHFLDWKSNAQNNDGKDQIAHDSVSNNAKTKSAGSATNKAKNKAALNEEADQTTGNDEEGADSLDLGLDRNVVVAGDSSDTKHKKISSFKYLSNRYASKKDAVKRTVIAGSITNTSPTASYRKIRLKITAVTSKGKRSEYSLELSSTKPLQPGQSVPYQQTLFDVASKKTEVVVTIVEAQIAN
jgi:transmembrane sensor